MTGPLRDQTVARENILRARNAATLAAKLLTQALDFTDRCGMEQKCREASAAGLEVHRLADEAARHA